MVAIMEHNSLQVVRIRILKEQPELRTKEANKLLI